MALCSHYFEHQNEINASLLYGVLLTSPSQTFGAQCRKMVKNNFTEYTFKCRIVVAVKLLL